MMIFDIPFSQLAELTLALLVGGLLTGFLAGLLGVGGGGIIVPILYELFGFLGVDESVRMVTCVATSLAIIIPTSIRSVIAHQKRGAFDLSVLKALGPWVFAGVIVGVIVASRSPSSYLKIAFVVSAVFISSRLLLKNGQPGGTGVLPGLPWNAAAGIGTGVISTLIGIGGGAYVSAYMAFFGFPIHTAVGTAAGFGPVIAIPAAIGYMIEGWHTAGLPPFSLGFVNVLGVAIIAPVSVLTAPVGVAVAHGLKPRTLELIFAAFLLTVATRFLFALLL